MQIYEIFWIYGRCGRPRAVNAPERNFSYLCGLKYRFRTLKYASLVKFAHTVFAMPFAMVGFVYGLRYAPLHNPRWPYIVLVQVILCMVFARNAAMGFNRWADRRIDAENPRTAGREIPAGKIPARHALWFVTVNALLFILTAATINRLAAILSPVALSVILVYSYCKRFTPLAHLVLGLSLGIAPVGAFMPIRPYFICFSSIPFRISWSEDRPRQGRPRCR